MAWSFQCGPRNFVTFNLGFILTYSIDLICLAFVVNGGRCQHNWRTPLVWRTKIFHVIVLPMLKILFFFKLEWSKILKDLLERTTQFVAIEITVVITLSFPFYS